MGPTPRGVRPMRHFLVVVEAVLVGVLGGGAFFRGRRWWRYQLFIPAVRALVICELAPVVLDVSTDLGEIAIAGLLMAQGTLLWVMLRKEQAVHALLLERIKLQVLAGVTDGKTEVFHAIKEIAQAIDDLSDATLDKWEDRYSLTLKIGQHA